MADPRKKTTPEAPAKTDKDVDDRVAELVARSRPFLPLAVIGAAGALGWLRGPGAAVLVLAGAALVLAIAWLWTSLRVLIGDAPVDIDAAVALASASEEDEQKRRILQSLKDLEAEHRLGKVTDEDFRVMSARQREEAKRILRAIDERLAPARKRAEEMLADRLAGDDEEDAPPSEPPPPKKKTKKKAVDKKAAAETVDASEETASEEKGDSKDA